MDPQDVAADSLASPDTVFGSTERLRSSSSSEQETSRVHARIMANSPRANATLHSSIAQSSIFDISRSSLFSSSTAGPGSSHTSPRFGATAGSSASPQRSLFLDGELPNIGGTALPSAEKARDDPSIPLLGESTQRDRHTPTALTRLLASRSMSSAVPSRSVSYENGNSNLFQQLSLLAPSLHDHLYTRGLLGGKHSDIAVIAFGHRYNLHRLILDRAPFFATALSAPWIESTAKEVVLHPEDVDPTITQKSFEIALKRLYGCDIQGDEDAEAVGLFATGCWLEMQDLVDTSVESILRQMGPDTLSPLIKLVTSNYYGRAGERILASAKAMLCRDGWEMALKYWDDIPGEIVREIVGGDGFYVPGEWDRWVLSKRLLDRRLREKAIDRGLVNAGSRASITHAPGSLREYAFRTETSRHKRTTAVDSQHKFEDWLSIYTDPDVEPFFVLLDQGIHYLHLSFERLQYIRLARDIFGVPVLPESVIENALWKQMELRQKVVNARENDMELGLSQPAEEQKLEPRIAEPPTLPETSKGKQKVRDAPSPSPGPDDGDNTESLKLNNQPRKFWIPSTDCNIVMGGNAEPVITTSTSSTFLRLASRMSTTLDPYNVLRATEFGTLPTSTAEGMKGSRGPGRPRSAGDGTTHPKPTTYSHFPPFRFAAEFPNPKSLKDKKRVYSRTVFYAGSHWNIYIQKVRSQKNPQLGVYLHRAKERETGDAAFSPLLSATGIGSVDERIGIFEREMSLGSSDGRRTMGRRNVPPSNHDAANRGENSSSGSAEADDGSMAAYRRRNYGMDSMSMLDTSYTAFDSEDSDSDNSPPGAGNFFEETAAAEAHMENQQGPSLTQFPPPSTTQKPQDSTPALPSYTDARPTIKTYFKIYSPSKGGRLLSVYESAPDKFDFSQSWGWKSSTLMLDEGFCSAEVMPGFAGGEEGGKEEWLAENQRRKRREGALRFMVVIGNL